MSDPVGREASVHLESPGWRPALRRLLRLRYFWIGVALALVSWLLESYVHVVFFDAGTFKSQLFTAEPHEIWKRLLIAGIIVAFGIYAQIGIDIRRKTELALMASESKYRTLIAEALNPVIVLDRMGRILEHNRAARVFFDNDDTIPTTKRYQELFWSSDPGVMEDILAVNAGQYEVNYGSGDDVRTLLFNVVPFDESHDTQLCFGIGQDFTERKRMHDELELAHAELQQIFQTSSSAMRVIDADHNVLRANEAFATLSGIRREDAVGATCFDTLPGDKCHTPDCPIDRILNGSKEVKYELTKTRSDGSTAYCMLTARPFLGWGGEPVGIVESFNDVTALTKAREELRDERDRLGHLLFQQAEGVAIIRPDHVIDYESETLHEEFGPCIGRYCFEALRGRTAPCPRCDIREALDSHQIQRREFERSGGRVFEHAYTPFRDDSGQEKVLVVLRDVTEHKASRASVIRSEQLAALGELAAGVAHEINNPINGIINYAQMLLNRERDHAQVREIAGKVRGEGDRVARIVESLLTFARRDSQIPVPSRVDELLRESLTLVGAQIRKDAIELSVEIPPDLPQILCVPQEIEQVFLNILSNARYALNERYPAAHGDKKLRITAALEKSGVARDVVIKFEDHGIGISESNLGKVARPFFSTKPKGKGTGLGLSICREIVHECGGHLDIRSVEGDHTEVKVVLPPMVA